MRGVLKRVKCPPLSKVTGERPVCQLCRKPLKPRTWYVEVLGHIGQALGTDALALAEQGRHPYPTASEAINAGYDASRVFRIEHRLSWNEEPSTKHAQLLVRHYGGYGWRGEEIPPSLLLATLRRALRCRVLERRHADQARLTHFLPSNPRSVHAQRRGQNHRILAHGAGRWPASAAS